MNWALGHFFRGFNWVFDRATRAYGKTVGWCLRLSAIVLAGLRRPDRSDGLRLHPRPDGLHPQPGQGPTGHQYPVARLGLAGAHGRSDARRSRRSPWRRPASPTRSPTAGRSFVLNAISSNLGSMFIPLKPFHERRDPALSADAIAARAPPAVSARDPRSPRERLRGAGGGRPGHRRRLQADGGGDRRR